MSFESKTEATVGPQLVAAGAFLVFAAVLGITFSAPAFREGFGGAGWYLPLGLLSALVSLLVVIGLLGKGERSWKSAVWGSTLNLIIIFTMFGVVQQGSDDAQDPIQYFLGFVFLMVMLVYGYVASPHTQGSHGLAVDSEVPDH